MLRKLLLLRNWARLAGLVTLFVAVIVCSFLWAISYPPSPSGGPVVEHNYPTRGAEQHGTSGDQRGTKSEPLAVEIVPPKKGTEEAERYEKESLEKSSNERGLTVATWVLAFATFFLFVAASVQVALFVWQLDLIRKSLVDAKKAAAAAEKSADAAKQNAEALMAAEAAQMYFIVTASNIDHLYSLGARYDNSPTMHLSPSDPPWVEYRLRNYGKSPAIVQSIEHGFHIHNPAVHSERKYRLAQEGMEIVGVGEQGQVLRCELLGKLNFGDLRSIVTNEYTLSFFGRAVFIDHFGRTQTLEWLHMATNGKWDLISHRTTRETENGKS
jgi:hypothetical protein